MVGNASPTERTVRETAAGTEIETDATTVMNGQLSGTIARIEDIGKIGMSVKTGIGT